MRALLETLALVLLLFGNWSNAVDHTPPPATDLIFVNPQDERLVLEKDTGIAILVPENISSKHPEESKLVAASDVLVQDVVIIRRGEPVLFNLAVEKPGAMSVGAVLTCTSMACTPWQELMFHLRKDRELMLDRAARWKAAHS